MSDSCHIANPGDPDIAGLGVTISFLASVCLTGAVILTLYFRGDVVQCNAIDNVIIRYFTKLFSKKPYVHEEDEGDWEWVTRDTHTSRAILKFLLTLSDQQLFMGLSLSLVTYIKLADRDNFSAYSFKMATTTIWLSCLTHISTVSTLNNHKSFITGWRVAAIVLLLLLLAPILVLSNLPMFMLDPSLSFRCAWDEISSYDRKTTLNFSLTAGLALMMVINGYARAFNLPYLQSATSSWLTRFVAGSAVQLDANRKCELALWIKERIYGNQQPQYPPISWRVLWLESLGELQQSFFWQLMWLTFYYTYGISSLIVAWTLLPPLEQWSLSYGQLLPVMALVFTFPALYDDLQAPKTSKKKAASHETKQLKTPIERREMTDNKDQGASHSVMISESKETDGIDTINPAGHSPSRRSSLAHKQPSSSGQAETDEYEALQRKALNAHKKYIGQSLSTTVDIAFKLSKIRTFAFLLVAGLVVFIWQQFLALLIGGVFYRLIADTQSRVWTGVIVLFSFPALVQTIFMVLIVVNARISTFQHRRREVWNVVMNRSKAAAKAFRRPHKEHHNRSEIPEEYMDVVNIDA